MISVIVTHRLHLNLFFLHFFPTFFSYIFFSSYRTTGLFPGGASGDQPFVRATVGRGDITIEGLQGLKSPADSGHLLVALNAGGGGNIKVIVNANGFLGQYEMLTTQGRVGVEIEGNEVEDDWKRKGCVPLPSNVLDHKPPETCMNEGMLVLNSTDGDLEFIVDTGS